MSGYQGLALGGYYGAAQGGIIEVRRTFAAGADKPAALLIDANTIDVTGIVPSSEDGSAMFAVAIPAGARWYMTMIRVRAGFNSGGGALIDVSFGGEDFQPGINSGEVGPGTPGLVSNLPTGTNLIHAFLGDQAFTQGCVEVISLFIAPSLSL